MCYNGLIDYGDCSQSSYWYSSIAPNCCCFIDVAGIKYFFDDFLYWREFLLNDENNKGNGGLPQEEK
jgi:hypothetical protein